MQTRIKQIFTETEKTPRFVSVVLDERNQQLLRHTVGSDLAFANTTLKDNQSCHHVTLLYQPTTEQWEELQQFGKIGDVVKIQCTELCKNNRIQAVKVELLNSNGAKLVSTAGKIYHITISALPNIPPVESNTMLASNPECKRFTTHLEGKIEIQY